MIYIFDMLIRSIWCLKTSSLPRVLFGNLNFWEFNWSRWSLASLHRKWNKNVISQRCCGINLGHEPWFSAVAIASWEAIFFQVDLWQQVVTCNMKTLYTYIYIIFYKSIQHINRWNRCCFFSLLGGTFIWRISKVVTPSTETVSLPKMVELCDGFLMIVGGIRIV